MWVYYLVASILGFISCIILALILYIGHIKLPKYEIDDDETNKPLLDPASEINTDLRDNYNPFDKASPIVVNAQASDIEATGPRVDSKKKKKKQKSRQLILPDNPTSTENFKQMFELLTTADYELVKAIVKMVPDDESILACLVIVFETQDETIPLLKAFIKQEVAVAPNHINLFRDHSVSSKLFEAYCKLGAHEYLQSTFGNVFETLIQANVSLEVDPNKVTVDEDILANTQNLIHGCKAFVDAIIKSLDSIPMNYRRICALINRTVRTKFSGVNTSCVGCFVFLHLYCPALIYPQSYGVNISTAINAKNRRGLTLISKTLYFLSLGEVFETEDQAYMKVMNAWIKEYIPKVHDFIQKLTTKPAIKPPKVKRDLVAAEEQTRAREALYRFLVANLNKLTRSIES